MVITLFTDLRIIEISGNSNNGIGDLLSEVGLSGLAHFYQNHRRDFLSEKFLSLALVLNLNFGTASFIYNLKIKKY